MNTTITVFLKDGFNKAFHLHSEQGAWRIGDEYIMIRATKAKRYYFPLSSIRYWTVEPGDQ